MSSVICNSFSFGKVYNFVSGDQFTLQPFPRQQILDSSKLKQFADDNFKFDEMAQSSPNGLKTLREEEKLLVRSNFSFSHSVFGRLVLQTRLKPGLVLEWVNSLPDDKILGLPNLKAFADDKLNVIQNVKLVFHRIENIVGKEEKMLVTRIFFFSHNVFKRLFTPVRQNSSLCGKGLTKNKSFASSSLKAFADDK